MTLRKIASNVRFRKRGSAKVYRPIDMLLDGVKNDPEAQLFMLCWLKDQGYLIRLDGSQRPTLTPGVARLWKSALQQYGSAAAAVAAMLAEYPYL